MNPSKNLILSKYSFFPEKASILKESVKASTAIDEWVTWWCGGGGGCAWSVG